MRIGEQQQCVCIVGDTIHAIGRVGVEGGISAYPNPASDELTVLGAVVAHNTVVFVQMKDMVGRVVDAQDFKLTSDEHLLRINTSDLSSGDYLLNWVAHQRKTTKKVMID